MSVDTQPSQAQSVNDVKLTIYNLIIILASYMFFWDPDWLGRLYAEYPFAYYLVGSVTMIALFVGVGLGISAVLAIANANASRERRVDDELVTLRSELAQVRQELAALKDQRLP